MPVIFMLRELFKVNAFYENSEESLIIWYSYLVAHDGCHFYAAQRFSKLLPMNEDSEESLI